MLFYGAAVDSWVAIDFETANEYRGSPCAIGVVAVEDGQVTDRWSTFIQPPPRVAWFSPFCVSLHGITAEHVRDAPSWPESLTELVRFAGGRPVVAHNAAFDLGVIREACTESDLAWPDLSYACTLVVARRTWSLLSYSLPWVAEAAGYRLEDHHDAGADALAAARIMSAAMRHHEAATLSVLLQMVRVRIGELTAGSWRGCQHQGVSSRAALPDANSEADPDGPFYGLAVCFTGTLSSMTRSRAWELVAEAGAQPAKGVSKKIDLLVVGTQDPRRLTPGATRSGKQAKAMALLKDGHPIEVISEVDFLERLAATEGIASFSAAGGGHRR